MSLTLQCQLQGPIAPLGMDLPAFFSAKEPATFYLGSKSAELAGLADACILVEGTRLPVHSHVLSLHSRVLLGLFVERSAGAGSVRCGAEEAIMSDKGTLAAYGLPVVAHFLRLVYRPETATPGALCWHSDMLAACCRLAHLLDTPLLLSKLDACMQHEVDKKGGPGLSSLVAITRAAEHCQLDALWARCVQLLAQSLLSEQQPGCSPWGQQGVRAAAPEPGFGAFGFGAPAVPAAAAPAAPAVPASRFTFGAPAAATCAPVEDVLKLQGLSSRAQLAVIAALVSSVRQSKDCCSIREGVQKLDAKSIERLRL